jgi:beta-glucanase (GH16 family)
MGFLKAATLLSCALPAVLAGAPTIPGFGLTWKDDFDGLYGLTPNLQNWIIDTGTSYPGGPPNWGTGEVQTYSAANLCLTGTGELKITPRKGLLGRWTSGRIETQRTDFMAKAGGKMRIQARIKVPGVTGANAAGYWPAFWALGAAYRGNFWNWPSVGEIDIMEVLNGENTVRAVLHCGTNPGGICNEPNGISGSRSCPATACPGNFHTYTVEVDRSVTPEIARWFVDGQLYHSVTQTQLGAQVWAETFHHGHFILLNVAIGGGFPDALYGSKTPTARTEGGHPMVVDYVAVYNSATYVKRSDESGAHPHHKQHHAAGTV